MKKLVISFEIVDKDAPTPKGYKSMTEEAIKFFKTYITKIVAFLLAITLCIAVVDFFIIEHQYLLNIKTGNIHLKDCFLVMSDSRYIRYDGTAFKILMSGYHFCSQCNPYF